MRYIKKIFVYLFTFFIVVQSSFSQNTTSPYSILGIGDIETKDFGRWYGMGSTSIALGSPYYLNASNPASLMTLNERMMTFDIANRGKSAKFMYATADTFTATTKDFSVRRVSIAFRPNKNWAFSFGLKPFSTINYLLNETNKVYSNASILSKQIDGSGGLNQAYFSYARAIGKHLSFGITSSYYFGSANIKTQYYGSALTADLDRQVYNIMSAFQFQVGMQYASELSPLLKQRLGFTISNPSVVSQRLDIDYLSDDVTIKTTSETKKDFKLPLSFGFGYAMIYNDRLTISADAVFSNWAKQKVDYPNSYTTPSGRISAGFEYASMKKINGHYYENWYMQGGMNIENNYIKIKNKELYSYGLTVGFGKNLSGLMSVYAGYELGKKGKTSYGQITEKYSQFILGVTLKEFWYNMKKYGRFQ